MESHKALECSALAIAAQFISGDGAAWVKVVSVILNIFAVMTAFFGVYLGFREATQGIVMNILRRKIPADFAGLERHRTERPGVELHLYL